jgi:hypothetical protein
MAEPPAGSRLSGGRYRRDSREDRDGAVVNGPVCVALAVTSGGRREILGLWAGDGNEGAKYWLLILIEIKTRGVKDVMVCDGLKGLPEAVESVWPKTIAQTCVVHLLRNSFRYAARQDGDRIAKVLKPVYTVATDQAALNRFAEFADAWGRKYPVIVKLWENVWEEFTPFLRFDTEIRRIVCTTNAIASVIALIRAGGQGPRPPPNWQASHHGSLRLTPRSHCHHHQPGETGSPPTHASARPPHQRLHRPLPLTSRRRNIPRPEHRPG